MNARSYRLTVLLHPESSAEERAGVEALVGTWAGDHAGTVRNVAAGEKKLAYAVKHQGQATVLSLLLSASPEAVSDLLAQLGRRPHVLRARLFRGEIPAGKRLRDLPPKKREAKRAAPAAKVARKAAKRKAPIEKLGEKIDEILEEEVL